MSSNPNDNLEQANNGAKPTVNKTYIPSVYFDLKPQLAKHNRMNELASFDEEEHLNRIQDIARRFDHPLLEDGAPGHATAEVQSPNSPRPGNHIAGGEMVPPEEQNNNGILGRYIPPRNNYGFRGNRGGLRRGNYGFPSNKGHMQGYNGRSRLQRNNRGYVQRGSEVHRRKFHPNSGGRNYNPIQNSGRNHWTAYNKTPISHMSLPPFASQGHQGYMPTYSTRPPPGLGPSQHQGMLSMSMQPPPMGMNPQIFPGAFPHQVPLTSMPSYSASPGFEPSQHQGMPSMPMQLPPVSINPQMFPGDLPQHVPSTSMPSYPAPPPPGFGASQYPGKPALPMQPSPPPSMSMNNQMSAGALSQQTMFNHPIPPPPGFKTALNQGMSLMPIPPIQMPMSHQLPPNGNASQQPLPVHPPMFPMTIVLMPHQKMQFDPHVAMMLYYSNPQFFDNLSDQRRGGQQAPQTQKTLCEDGIQTEDVPVTLMKTSDVAVQTRKPLVTTKSFGTNTMSSKPNKRKNMKDKKQGSKQGTKTAPKGKREISTSPPSVQKAQVPIGVNVPIVSVETDSATHPNNENITGGAAEPSSSTTESESAMQDVDKHITHVASSLSTSSTPACSVASEEDKVEQMSFLAQMSQEDSSELVPAETDGIDQLQGQEFGPTVHVATIGRDTAHAKKLRKSKKKALKKKKRKEIRCQNDKPKNIPRVKQDIKKTTIAPRLSENAVVNTGSGETQIVQALIMEMEANTDAKSTSSQTVQIVVAADNSEAASDSPSTSSTDGYAEGTGSIVVPPDKPNNPSSLSKSEHELDGGSGFVAEKMEDKEQVPPIENEVPDCSETTTSDTDTVEQTPATGQNSPVADLKPILQLSEKEIEEQLRLHFIRERPLFAKYFKPEKIQLAIDFEMGATKAVMYVKRMRVLRAINQAFNIKNCPIGILKEQSNPLLKKIISFWSDQPLHGCATPLSQQILDGSLEKRMKKYRQLSKPGNKKLFEVFKISSFLKPNRITLEDFVFMQSTRKTSEAERRIQDEEYIDLVHQTAIEQMLCPIDINDTHLWPNTNQLPVDIAGLIRDRHCSSFLKYVTTMYRMRHGLCQSKNEMRRLLESLSPFQKEMFQTCKTPCLPAEANWTLVETEEYLRQLMMSAEKLEDCFNREIIIEFYSFLFKIRSSILIQDTFIFSLKIKPNSRNTITIEDHKYILAPWFRLK